MINENFSEYGFLHDKPMWLGDCDCTHRRRVDHRALINDTVLAVETDEFAHGAYNLKDEEVRYDDLVAYHTSKWIFIRFNPDGKGVSIDDKLRALRDEIAQHIQRICAGENLELVEIHKLFY
jgi:hypothetical protein